LPFKKGYFLLFFGHKMDILTDFGLN